MNCLFCPDKEIVPHWDGMGKRNKCPQCWAYYLITGSEIEMCYYNRQFKYEIYRASYYLIDNAAYRFFVSLAKSPPGEYILRLKEIPKDITPFNFTDKIPTILTFL